MFHWSWIVRNPPEPTFFPRRKGFPIMGTIVVLLLLALALSAAVIFYTTYPYRGAPTPLTPRLGEAMRRGVESLPTIDPRQAERVDSRG